MKESKNSHLSKGVNPWVWSKNGHFFNFVFLGNIDQANVFHDIAERKNAFLGYKKKKLKKSKNSHLSKGVNPWVWSKNGHFANFFFRQYGPENYFLRYSSSKKSHGFGRKMAILPTSFFRQYRPIKCFSRYPRTKKRLSNL